MKTIVLLLLALTATSVMSACEANFITRANEITIEEAEITVGEQGYQYCGYTETSQTCCSMETVNGFADRVTDLIEDLELLAGERDQYILDRRGDVLDLKTSLNRIRAAIDKLSGGQASGFEVFEVFAQAFTGLSSTVIDQFDELKGNFTEFQEARSDCMKALIEAQAAAWCYACTPNFAEAPGISGSAITFGSDFTERITGSCYPYLELSAGQSLIISLYTGNAVLGALASFLEKIADGGLPDMDDINTLTQSMSGIANPIDVNQQPSTIPASCSRSTCNWLVNSVLNNGNLQGSVIIRGGTEAPAQGSRRLLVEEEIEVPAGRRLDGEWNPPADYAGITVEFDSNPGEVNNDQNGSSSAIRNGIVACAVAVLAFAF